MANITREYKLGGMGYVGAGSEVVDTMNKIDGVKKVNVEESTQKLSIQFDSDKVSEEHLISTLNSLGHGILNDK